MNYKTVTVVRKYKCCLCGKVCDGHGNNPFPLVDEEDTFAECCDECNLNKVIPARIKLMYKHEENID